MQIQQIKKEELMLLIHGLKSVYVDDLEHVRQALLKQLEQELSTRYGVCLVDA